MALCTYNGEKYLPELLESVLCQSVVPNEVVIVDDCSSDGTVRILKEYASQYPVIKLSLQEKNSGPISSFEKAIQLTSSPYIFLADQDDIWHRNKIENMLSQSFGYSQEKPFLLYSDLEVINEEGKLIHSSFWKMAALKPEVTTFKSMLFGNPVTGCASMINSKMRELLVSIPQGIMMHDHWIALIAYGFGQAAFMPEPLVRYRVHSTSVTDKKQSNAWWKIKTQFFHFFDSTNGFLEKEIKQVILFNQMFRKYLSKENQLQVDTFIGLKDKPLLERKLSSFLKYRP